MHQNVSKIKGQRNHVSTWPPSPDRTSLHTLLDSGLDFTPADRDSLREETPIIVALHGLTGGSYESYVRSILYPACSPVENGGLGYRGIVVNFRGCAGVPVTSPQLYSAGHTDDIRQALMYISQLYPKAPLIGIGFSLGANVLIRYLAEEGPSSRLIAGCALGCPWDLKKNNHRLKEDFISRNVYSRGMGNNLTNLLRKHVIPLSADPNTLIAQALPKAIALNRPEIETFDNHVTRLIGGSSPPFPFATADDYYTWGSSHKVIADVTVPLLTINAADDPVVQYVPMLAEGNSSTVVVLTPAGGHLGWFESNGLTSVQRWVAKPVLEWIRAAIEDLDLQSTPPELHTDSEGYFTEQARNHLGCRVAEELGGAVIQGSQPAEGVLQGL